MCCKFIIKLEKLTNYNHLLHSKLYQWCIPNQFQTSSNHNRQIHNPNCCSVHHIKNRLHDACLQYKALKKRIQSVVSCICSITLRRAWLDFILTGIIFEIVIVTITIVVTVTTIVIILKCQSRRKNENQRNKSVHSEDNPRTLLKVLLKFASPFIESTSTIRCFLHHDQLMHFCKAIIAIFLHL